jgi:hypothetical protein
MNMKGIKIKYVPVAGLLPTIARHWRACGEYKRRPTDAAYQATLTAYDDFYVALASTSALFILALVAAAALLAR